MYMNESIEHAVRFTYLGLFARRGKATLIVVEDKGRLTDIIRSGDILVFPTPFTLDDEAYYCGKDWPIREILAFADQARGEGMGDRLLQLMHLVSDRQILEMAHVNAQIQDSP